MGTKKYYVIWKGKETGVFSSWEKVKNLVQGYEGAKYMSFGSKVEANKAIKKNYTEYQSVKTKKGLLSDADKAKYGIPLKKSLTVDAACSGNPGKMEYRGVLNHNKQEVFKMGPFELMDLIGIDINYSVTQSVWQAYSKEARFEPHKLQKQK